MWPGDAVEIKNNLRMAWVTVNHLWCIDDSVLGRRINLEAGTNVANLRHDDEPVKRAVNDERVSTGSAQVRHGRRPQCQSGDQHGLECRVTDSCQTTTKPGKTVTAERSPRCFGSGRARRQDDLSRDCSIKVRVARRSRWETAEGETPTRSASSDWVMPRGTSKYPVSMATRRVRYWEGESPVMFPESPAPGLPSFLR